MALAAYAWLLIVLKRTKKSPLSAYFCLLLWHQSARQTLESDYVQGDIEGFGFLFPNTLTTITETARISLSDILVSACGSLEMGLVCAWPWIMDHSPSGKCIGLWPAGGIRSAELRCWQPGCFLLRSNLVVWCGLSCD